ncbi:hypothetical protein LXA43DRAFT_1136548 [Ganoderma leucocontextum]|nr:hypothetical protein LXA43DRAFT_1136548 [Ganoderma leucocontextum]
MPSMTAQSVSHSHGLHLIIPTTSAPRVPSASTPKTTTAERRPTPLDTPSHSHGLFVLPRPANDSTIPGHSHGLFRLPASHRDATTPTTPKMSARASRRSSLFSMHDSDEPEQHAMAAAAAPAHAQELMMLPPTSEAEEEEPNAGLRDLKVVGDGQFHVEGNNDGGNN